MRYIRRLSQRELRNDNARVMRDVEAGESYVVTRRGVPVARLVPVDAAAEIRCVRPAQRVGRFSELGRVRARLDTAPVLDSLRGER